MSSAVINGDYQIDLRGVLFGAAAPYVLRQADVADLWDLADIRAADLVIPGRNGLTGGDDFYGGMAVTFGIDVRARDAALTSAVDALRAAFARSDVDLPLYVQMFGTQRLRWVRPRRLSIDMTQAPFGLARATAQVMVMDPFGYADAESAASASVSVAASALTFPVTFPITFGATYSPGSLIATNAGTAPANWVATITGPVTDPTLINNTTGQTLSLTGVVPVGLDLVIDSKSRTIILDGSVNRADMRDLGSEWFDLVPGANYITYDASPTPPIGSLTLSWRSAWH